jgi:nicotinamidase-related amidase
MVLSAQSSQLIVIDIQERLLPAIDGGERIVNRTALLLKAAQELAVPVLASEQYPTGLGKTVPALAEALLAEDVIEKLEFSLPAAPGALQRIHDRGRKQVVVAGIEAHICVLQTAMSLMDHGFSVHVVADAIGSRDPDNKAFAVDRLRQAGISVVTTEMVVFEWLERAGTDTFRTLSRLVR